jgi:hypothetical protein
VLYVAFGGSYYPIDGGADVPYFFMDVATYGPWPILAVAVLAIGVGYGVFGLDRLVMKRINPRKAGE